jgi:hypothetical protein
MFKMLEELVDEYLTFQRSRPDLPQGNWVDLSEDELEQIVLAFQEHKTRLSDREWAERPPRIH